MIAQILLYAQRILGVVTQIVAIVTGIQQAQGAQATEALATEIFDDTEEIKLKVLS